MRKLIWMLAGAVALCIVVMTQSLNDCNAFRKACAVSIASQQAGRANVGVAPSPRLFRNLFTIAGLLAASNELSS